MGAWCPAKGMAHTRSWEAWRLLKGLRLWDKSTRGFCTSSFSHGSVLKLLCAPVTNALLFKKAVDRQLMPFSWGWSVLQVWFWALWFSMLILRNSGERALWDREPSGPVSWSLSDGHLTWSLSHLGSQTEGGCGRIMSSWVKTLRRRSLPLKTCEFRFHLNFALKL